MIFTTSSQNRKKAKPEDVLENTPQDKYKKVYILTAT